MSTHVLFTETGREDYAANLLSRVLPAGMCESIYVPKVKQLLLGTGKINLRGVQVVEQTTYRGRESYTVLHTLFPSYLFVETEEPDQLLYFIYNLRIETNFLMLGRKVGDLRVVKPDELERLDHLCGSDHVLDVTIGVKEGTKVRFISGPLVGLEAYVKKVSIRKRHAEVELPMLGQMRRIYVPLEVIEQSTE